MLFGMQIWSAAVWYCGAVVWYDGAAVWYGGAAVVSQLCLVWQCTMLQFVMQLNF